RRSRFWFPTHAGNRTPDSREPGLLEDLSLLDARGEAPRGRRRRHHPFRWAAKCVRQDCAASRPGDFQVGRPRAGHLLWRAAHGLFSRRESRPEQRTRVWTWASDDQKAGQAIRGPAAQAADLEFPWRQADEITAGIQ